MFTWHFKLVHHISNKYTIVYGITIVRFSMSMYVVGASLSYPQSGGRKQLWPHPDAVAALQV